MSLRATVGGSALGFAVGWNVSNIGAVAEQTAAEYGVALATVGLFTTALFAVHAVLQIPAGQAVDRHGARRVGLWALLVLTAANGLALAAPDAGLAMGARALAGLGTALGFVAGSDYVRARGGSSLAQGLYGGIALGGSGLALAIVPLLDGPLAWRGPFASAVAVALAAGAALALGPSDLERTGAVRRGFRDARGLLADTRLYRLCALYMASLGLSVVAANWAVTLLVRAGGQDEKVAGAIASLTLAGGVVSRPAGGWIARRHPARARAAVAASLVASGLATAALTAARPLALTALAALVLGLASGIPFAPAFGAAARTRPDAPAAAVAMVNMCANLVIVAGTPLLGLAFYLPGDGRIGFAIVSALWLAALAVLPRAQQLAGTARSRSRAERGD